MTKKHRRRQLESDSLAPIYQEKRWSSRRAAQVVTPGAYQESDVDFEDESEIMTPNYWVGDTEDTTPYIDVVLKHRPKEGKEIHANSSRDDF